MRLILEVLRYLAYFILAGAYPLCEIPIHDIMAVENLEEESFTRKYVSVDGHYYVSDNKDDGKKCCIGTHVSVCMHVRISIIIACNDICNWGPTRL